MLRDVAQLGVAVEEVDAEQPAETGQRGLLLAVGDVGAGAHLPDGSVDLLPAVLLRSLQRRLRERVADGSRGLRRLLGGGRGFLVVGIVAALVRGLDDGVHEAAHGALGELLDEDAEPYVAEVSQRHP